MSIIGSGSYSKVYSCSNNTVNKRVTLINQDDENDDPEIEYTTIRELAFLSLFKHPNIIEKISHKIHDGLPCYTSINMENAGMDLYDFASSISRKQRGKHITTIAFQLIKALYYLEINNIVHADIKPSNIMIKPDTLKVILIDFGGCLFEPSETESVIWCSTKGFRAPEHLKGSNQPYLVNSKNDVFSFGLSMFAYYFDKAPKSSYVPKDSYDVLAAFDKTMEDLCHFENLDILNILLMCIRTSNEARPKASELYKLKYFKELRQQDDFCYKSVSVDIPEQNETYAINEGFKPHMTSILKSFCSSTKLQEIYVHSYMLLEKIMAFIDLTEVDDSWLDYLPIFSAHITYLLLDNSKKSKDDIFYEYEDYNIHFIDIVTMVLPIINFNVFMRI
jgi:serine/threonine protein kinase